MLRMNKTIIALTLLLMGNVTFADEQTNNYELAVKAYQLGDENEAFIHLKNALKANPQHLSSKLLLAKVYFNANNLAAAEEQLEEALSLGADINLVLPLLGNVLLLQGKIDAVLALEQRSAEFSKNSQFEWKLLRGRIYLRKSQVELAKLEFEQALQLAPNQSSAINTLATLYLAQKEYLLADKLVTHSLAINNNNERTWKLKGDLVAAQGMLEQALVSYEHAISIDPEDPKILRSLVMTNLKLNRLEQAKHYLQRIQKQTPNDPTAILINATLLAKQDEFELAEQSLAELSQKISAAEGSELTDPSMLLFIQGASEFIRQNDEKAQQYLSQYLKAKPSDLGATRMLAKVYLRSDQAYKLQLLLQDNFEYILPDLGLSAQLVYLYIESGRIRAAQQAFEQMRAYHSKSNYIGILEAELLRASGEPQQAFLQLTSLPYSDDQSPLKWLQLKGELALEIDDIDAAKLSIDSLIKRKVNTTQAQNLIAAYYIKMNQADLALQYLNKVLAKSPENISAMFNKALIFQTNNDLDQALTIFQQILKIEPQHSPSHLVVARIYFQQQAYADATAQLDKVLIYEPDNRVAKELKLDIYMQTQQWPLALTLVEKLNREYILNEAYLTRYAEILIQLERYQDTAYPLGLLDSLWKEQAPKLKLLASLQVRAKDLDGAKASLAKARALAPEDMSTLLMQGQIDLAQANIASAEVVVSQLTEQFGESSELYALQGGIFLAKDDPLAAQKAYSQALTLNKFNRGAAIHLYQLAQQNIAVDEFTEQLEGLLDNSSQMAWHRRLLADTYMRQKNYAKAQSHYEALRKFPSLKDEPSLINNLANIYAKSDLDKAFALIEISLQQGSKSSATLDTIGWIEAQRSHFDQALLYLREAYTTDSSDPTIRYHLAYVLAKLGRVTEAKIELKSALAIAQNFAEYEDAKQLLSDLEKNKA
ncbi:XrtA/PEP-CTERM system TPR-repeat protein PrsT [Agarivorans sp. QJM3NY_25]|uniref:XrtA/PEP-CTERM system TPR-repeat protein PrsT n=1 Tax=Agarivorans sp. QJM3NY_25 TaxID=3421430 RepID=UPI003F6C19B8